MKRKYYMRGLGLGILVTAILCAVALPKQTQPMTDEEIIARAEELGYVKDEGGITAEDINKIKENEKASGTPGATEAPNATEAPETTTAPEGTPGPTQSPVPTPDAPEPPEEPDKPDVPATPTPKPTATPAPKPTATTAPKPTATSTPKPTATTAPKATSTPTPTKAPEGTDEQGQTAYTIKVERGATARRVAQQLEAAGAVADSEAFVKYLQSRKLTDFINIGTFTIPKGASHADIARILTGK